MYIRQSPWLSVFNFHFFLFGIFGIGKPESFRTGLISRGLISCSYFSGGGTEVQGGDRQQDLPAALSSHHHLVKDLKGRSALLIGWEKASTVSEIIPLLETEKASNLVLGLGMKTGSIFYQFFLPRHIHIRGNLLKYYIASTEHREPFSTIGRHSSAKTNSISILQMDFVLRRFDLRPICLYGVGNVLPLAFVG